MKKTIAVIFGGDSVEHDISIITGVQTANILDSDKYKVIPVYLRDNKLYYGKALKNLKSFMFFKSYRHKKAFFKDGRIHRAILGSSYTVKKVDCAVLCTHGGEGENGVLQGYLAYNQIPYTSPNVFQCALFMDKAHTKEMLKSHKVKTLDYKIAHRYDFNKDNEKLISIILKGFKYPLIVKPCSLGSSIGISKVNNDRDLLQALDYAFQFDYKVLIEPALENFQEINMALFRMSNGEIVFGQLEEPVFGEGFLTFTDKYMSGTKGLADNKRIIPAEVKEKTKEKIEFYSKTVYEELDCKGIIRIDYLIKDDVVYLNEVNAIPGSLAYYLFKGKGIKHAELIENLIESTLKLEDDCIIKKFNTSVLENLQNGNKGSVKL